MVNHTPRPSEDTYLLQSRTETLIAHNAMRRLMTQVYTGHFDYSTRERWAYLALICASAYFSYESAKMYIKIGGDGTHLLPIGHFSETFGGWSAFACNAALNWYFMVLTAFDIRRATLNYQLSRKLNLPVHLKSAMIKLSFAVVMAATTGFVFSKIASSSNTSKYNQVVTGAVNSLLNLLGSYALVNSIISCVKWAANKSPLFTYQSKDTSVFDKAVSRLSTYDTTLIRKDAARITKLEDHIELCISEPTSDEQFNSIQSPRTVMLKKAAIYGLNGFMQVCSAISLYGYYRDTEDQFSSQFKIYGGSSYLLTTFIFMPFFMLCAKVVWETTYDILDSARSAQNAVKKFKTLGTVESAKQISFYGPAIGTSCFGFLMAYVSANSSLALNEDYGFDSWWNIYPTCIGAAVFNGFAIMVIALQLSKQLAQKYLNRRSLYPFYNRNKQAMQAIEDLKGSLGETPSNSFSMNSLSITP